MMLRSSAFFLLLLISAATLSQTSDQPNPNVPKSFHDPSLNVTYFYPGRFVPDPESIAPKPNADASPKCAHSTLFAHSLPPVLHLLLRALAHRHHLPQRPAWCDPPRPLHPRADSPSA